MIDLFDYFSHVFEVESLDQESIEQVIMNRHRVSGFELEYEPTRGALLYQDAPPAGGVRRAAQSSP